jgi:4'-phosphopantetheinyl transferase
MNADMAEVQTGVHRGTSSAKPHAWPRLNEDEIHVWKVLLDDSTQAQDRALLSADELKRAGRYRFEQDRVRFIAGRARLRMILGGYLGRPPKDLVFIEGPHGKPCLKLNEGDAPLHFNVTHADELALYAVARGGEVGIDVEPVREIPDWSVIAETVFSPDEQTRLRSLSDDRRRLGFLQVWTRHEALLKAAGEGLCGDSDEQLLQESGYAVHSMTPAPGYLAALASRFTAQSVIFLMWAGSSIPLTPIGDF